MLISCGGTKGGPGKTTLAVNLAVWRARQGRDVLLVDSDPQQSAKVWWELRMAAGVQPAVDFITLLGDEVHVALHPKLKRYDDIIVDGPGYDAIELRSIMQAVDKIVAPIRPGVFDLATMPKLDNLLKFSQMYNPGVHVQLVRNFIPPHAGSNDAEVIAASVAKRELQHIQMLDALLRNRRNLWDSVSVGRTVFDATDIDEKAIAEMDAVAQEVFNG